MMDRVFVRSYVLFFFALVVCCGALIYTLIVGNISIGHTDDRVEHTHDVIAEVEQLSTLVEGMLASQRGYIITGNKDFLAEYDEKKAEISNNIARISELTLDNPSQASRLAEMRDYYVQFVAKLDERAAKYKPLPNVNESFLDDVEIIGRLKNNMTSLNASVLEEEYGLLNQRIKAVDAQKSQYFLMLLVGCVLSGALLLLFNGFLLRSQRKRNLVETSLKSTEERFKLAVEGTQDGIFDWNLETGEVFYSAQIFNMLGMKNKSFIGTTEEFKNLLHPEDAPRVWKTVEDYLAGTTPEYAIEFRLKHQDGHWVWVNARARSIKDKDGKPVRMVGAHTDISLLKERQEKLEVEKKSAEHANRAKSDFLAHMSHEIRTPLTAISGIAEIFQTKLGNLDDRQKQLVSTLHSSTAALKALINDVLDFSKIEGGELELDCEKFQLADVFEEVISMMSLRANEKAISFVFDYDELVDATFYGDKLRLRQILLNLVGNAIKFTDEGYVRVKACVEDRDGSPFLRVDVSDTGIGIAPEHFDLVFERFKQADSTVSRRYGGTGLGLPISKNLANLMDGKIILSSQAGKGSTFTLLLPDKESSLKVKIQKSPDSVTNFNSKLKSFIGKETRVLLVEDYEANIAVMSYILDDLGFPYDVARNGREGVELWKKNNYAIVLMDVQMPVMDGFTATQEIRTLERQEQRSRTPVIGITAHALVGDKDKCIEAGMDSYLPKPVVENDLKREMLKFMSAQKAA